MYFASDFHLGVPTFELSLAREKKVRWLDSIKHNAEEIYLVGDIFDFWWEYKYTIPKGQTRLLGKIAELTDGGIPVHFFTGNHDLWMKDYFIQELGVTVNHDPIKKIYNNKSFLIGHGDGLGPGDGWYKFLKKCFKNPFLIWCFKTLHPNFGFWIARRSSKRSRITTGDSDKHFLGDDNEWLMTYCKEQLKKEHTDFFIFGHRHLPLDLKASETSRYINLGEWINYCSYAVFDGNNVELKTFEG
ncbi:MAG: UDP-2,3-diacylglucosamine diphosphatase [Sphingobacteriaceae bacterium]|nr:UDP-2,3-diacylglucosamine diphosphatase [Sphingobacteriaceae bacterium]